MHPTTYEFLAKDHIRDLQPARTWPAGDRAQDSPGVQAASRNVVRAVQVLLQKVPILRGLGARAAVS